MLPFFRKIRFQLAKDNQFLKYSRYAIGEIVLVVLGILIALQINNWNEERKNEKIKQVYLKSLIDELKTNCETFNSRQNLFDKRIASFDNLFRIINTYPDAPDSLRSGFIQADTYIGVHSIKTTAFEELINSENFQVFEKELRDRILTFYNEMDDRLKQIDVDLEEVRTMRMEAYKSVDLAYLYGYKKFEYKEIRDWTANINSTQFTNATNFFTIRKLQQLNSKRWFGNLSEMSLDLITELESHLDD